MMNAVPTKAPVTVAQIAIGILAKRGTPMHWRDLAEAVIAARGPVAAGVDRNRVIAGVYTDINLDNRFNYAGDGLWGLREWAPKGQPARAAVPLAASLRGRREKVQREEEVFAADEDEEEAADGDGESTPREEDAAEEEWEEPEER